MTEAPVTKCGFVGVIGAPNAGKSTLVNRVAGAKLAIVTHKAQTTRARLRAIVMIGASQVILVDTPGIFHSRDMLGDAMVQAAWNSVSETKETLLVVDARQREPDEAIIARLEKAAGKVVLVLNKIDLVERQRVLETIRVFNERFSFCRTFLISALNGDGVEDLKRYLGDNMPVGPWLYPEDQAADIPVRALAAEITREQLLLRLHEELPYQCAVETGAWKERTNGDIRVEQTIYVQRDSQRKIMLGNSGATIKAVGAAARAVLGDALGTTVHLFLFVKVKKNWSRDPAHLRALGLPPARTARKKDRHPVSRET